MKKLVFVFVGMLFIGCITSCTVKKSSSATKVAQDSTQVDSLAQDSDSVATNE